MTIKIKREPVTLDEDVVYVVCDKCKVELKSEGLNTDGWMTCVRPIREQRDNIRAMEYLMGKDKAQQMAAPEMARNLCGKCADLFEKFVNDQMVLDTKEDLH